MCTVVDLITDQQSGSVKTETGPVKGKECKKKNVNSFTNTRLQYRLFRVHVL